MQAIVGPFQTYLPGLLGAIVILVVGYIVAVIISSVVKAALSRTGLGARIAKAIGEQPSSAANVEHQVGRVVFWVILIFVLIAFFQALGLTGIATPLNGLLLPLFAFIPRLLGAAVLAVIAYIVARVLRFLVQRLGAAAHLDDRLRGAASGTTGAVSSVTTTSTTSTGTTPHVAQTYPAEGGQAGTGGGGGITNTLSQIVYYLVWLLFLPGILDALGMQGLLTPVLSLLNQIFAFLPNIISAALILVIGVFVARLVRRIVTDLLRAIGTERLSARLGLGQALGQQGLSGLLGTIVYILILLPVATAALNALQLGSLTAPISNMLNTVLQAIPNIITAAIVLVVAYVLGRVVYRLVTDLLTGIGFNSFPARIGLTGAATAGGRTPSEFVGYLAWGAIILFGLIEALQFLNFAVLTQLVAQFTVLIGHVLIGLIILGIGLYLANLVARMVSSSGVTNANLLAHVARWFIILLTLAMALRQMGLANEIINLAFGLLLGAIAVAAALAFGLGGRDSAGRIVEQWRRRIESGNVDVPPPSTPLPSTTPLNPPTTPPTSPLV